MPNCQARSDASGEMHCAACRLRWDHNDPEPPLCPRTQIAQRDLGEALDAPSIAPEKEPFVSALAPVRSWER